MVREGDAGFEDLVVLYTECHRLEAAEAKATCSAMMFEKHFEELHRELRGKVNANGAVEVPAMAYVHLADLAEVLGNQLSEENIIELGGSLLNPMKTGVQILFAIIAEKAKEAEGFSEKSTAAVQKLFETAFCNNKIHGLNWVPHVEPVDVPSKLPLGVRCAYLHELAVYLRKAMGCGVCRKRCRDAY